MSAGRHYNGRKTTDSSAMSSEPDSQDEARSWGTSPRATGPSGSGLEVSVAVHYALGLLGGGEARGLPGATVESIEFQRGALGHPLDDIIVHARGSGAVAQVLDIQVKRSMTFTASDANFAAVVWMPSIRRLNEP